MRLRFSVLVHGQRGIGATLALPVGRRHAVKLSVSRGAIIRFGSNFSTISIGWHTAWFPSPKKS